MKTTIYLTFFLLFLVGCSHSQNKNSMEKSKPYSEFYQPLDATEKIFFEKSDKCILPYDVRKNSEKYLNKIIHWIGIVDTFTINTERDSLIADIYLQQRYWDYIEDYSIQQERMFVSPYGEGFFILRSILPKDVNIDTLKYNMDIFAKKENLIFAYGKLIGLQDTVPILESYNTRVVLKENYATNIASYKVERDNQNNVVKDKNGIPKTKDWKFLKIAGPGRNQYGSRLKNSKD